MNDWELVVTPSEVLSDSLSSTDTPADKPKVTRRAVEDVTSRITAFLGFDPIVAKHTQGIPPRQWRDDQAETDDTARAWADAQPIVEVDSPSDVSIRHTEREFNHDTIPDETIKVVYFAGWKRSDQSLSDFPTGSNDPLDGLTVEPNTIPSDIRRVAVRLVLFELSSVESSVGMGQMTQVPGQGQSITVEGADPQFVPRELRKLSKYKTSAFA